MRPSLLWMIVSSISLHAPENLAWNLNLVSPLRVDARQNSDGHVLDEGAEDVLGHLDDAAQALDHVFVGVFGEGHQVFDGVGEVDQDALDVGQEVEERLVVRLELANDRNQNVDELPLVPRLDQSALPLQVRLHELQQNLQSAPRVGKRFETNRPQPPPMLSTFARSAEKKKPVPGLSGTNQGAPKGCKGSAGTE